MDYNPGKSKTNCGFCSIARALDKTKGIEINADRLYEQTLERLGIQRNGDRDPIPRMLIFPEAGLDTLAVRGEYAALEGGALGLSSYTITSVAEANGLRFDQAVYDVALPNQFLSFYAKAGAGSWNIRDFEEMRLNFLRSQGAKPAPEALSGHIRKALAGHSIMGSKKSNHFINVHIDPSGHITAFDAQDGITYDGRGLYNRLLGSVDLFMRFR